MNALRPSSRAARSRGFTLLEVLIALVLMGIAGLGAIAGLSAASQNLRSGQLRQVEMALLDAKSARLMLMDKSALVALAKPRPTSASVTPDTLAVGDATAWTPDSSTSTDANDLGAGAYFYFLPNGQITRAIPGTTLPGGATIAANTPCATASSPGTPGGKSVKSLPTFPGGPYCRELAVTVGLPPPGGTFADSMNTQITSTAATVYTLWVRISRVGDPDSSAIVQREVFTQ